MFPHLGRRRVPFYQALHVYADARRFPHLNANVNDSPLRDELVRSVRPQVIGTSLHFGPRLNTVGNYLQPQVTYYRLVEITDTHRQTSVYERGQIPRSVEY